MLVCKKAIVEATNYPTDGEKEPRREITITKAWTACLTRKDGPLDLSIIEHRYGATKSDRGKGQVMLIPVKLWVSAKSYSATLHYHLEEKHSWIGSPLNYNTVKLAEVLEIGGFITNELIHLKFIWNEVWVIKVYK